jgi:hypothetical protein
MNEYIIELSKAIAIAGDGASYHAMLHDFLERKKQWDESASNKQIRQLQHLCLQKQSSQSVEPQRA